MTDVADWIALGVGVVPVVGAVLILAASIGRLALAIGDHAECVHGQERQAQALVSGIQHLETKLGERLGEIEGRIGGIQREG